MRTSAKSGTTLRRICQPPFSRQTIILVLSASAGTKQYKNRELHALQRCHKSLQHITATAHGAIDTPKHSKRHPMQANGRQVKFRSGEQHSQRRILAAGYPQDAQTFFCLWKEVRPHRRQAVWVLLCLLPNEAVPFVYSPQQSVTTRAGRGVKVNNLHLNWDNAQVVQGAPTEMW